MVNIHVFNLNDAFQNDYSISCLIETLKYQTNYKLFIWKESNKEIKHFIEDGDYDGAYSYIGKKYGGWFLGLSEPVLFDISKLSENYEPKMSSLKFFKSEENFLETNKSDKVNIHLFDLSKTEVATLRTQECLRKTLKNQSNCIIYMWSLDSNEVQDIVDSSNYCQKIKELGFNVYTSIFQYIKMEILSRYGGWCFELDCQVDIDLCSLDLDYNFAYLPIFEYPTICAWEPIYMPKGFDISQTLEKANTYNWGENEIYNEFVICRIDAENIYNSYFLRQHTSHFQSPIFKFTGSPEIQKFSFCETGEILIEIKEYRKDIQSGANMTLKLRDKETFIECCKQFDTFKIIENIDTQLWMSRSFFCWISKFFEIPSKVNIRDDLEKSLW